MATSLYSPWDRPEPRLARASRHHEHTLLYLRFRYVDMHLNGELRRDLEHVTRRLWGPVTVTDLGDATYALLLESWSVERSLQLAGLLRTAVEEGSRRLGQTVRMQASAVTARGEVDLAALLARARRACDDAQTGARESHRQ